MSQDIGRFPSFAEIQDLREQYKQDPKFTKEIDRLIYLCLQQNQETIRNAARKGLTFYDFEEPHNLHSVLMDLRFSKADFYRLLEKRLRDLGYETLLSITKEYDDNTFCNLMICW